MQALNYRVATHKVGDVAEGSMSAGDGPPHDVAVRLELPPENPPRDLTTVGGRNPLTGAKIENLSPAVAVELQMGLMAQGVVVVGGAGNSSPPSHGFQPGDIVVSVNGADDPRRRRTRNAPWATPAAIGT